MDYISTGKAAKLLFVTPDAVLKWVKKGELKARKTAGGHYRVSLESINRLLSAEEGGLPGVTTEDPQRQFLPCWEFHAIEGKIKEECHSCIIFKARGTRCYEVARSLKEKGEGATCCTTPCEECPYYETRKLRPINVLVFSERAETIKQAFMKDGTPSRLRFVFTSYEYDCSLAVDKFHPCYVVVDCTGETAKCAELSNRLATDSRIPGAKILLALPSNQKNPGDLESNVEIIDESFGVAEIENYIDRFENLAEF